MNSKLSSYKEQTFRSKIREQLDQQKIITISKVIAVGVAVAQVDIDIYYISNFQTCKYIVIYSIKWYVRKNDIVDGCQGLKLECKPIADNVCFFTLFYKRKKHFRHPNIIHEFL